MATEEQAAHIERQWQIYHTIQSMSDEERVEYDKIRSSLVISSGSPPSHFDVKWTMCNKKLEENLRNGDWGLYRNARLEMAELLRGEDRIDEALRVFLEVMYLDINGPRNTGGVKDPAILREFPAFQPDLGLMAPAVVGSILELQEEIGFEKTDLSRRFEEEASRIRGQISLPITTDQAWQVFEDELLNWDQS